MKKVLIVHAHPESKSFCSSLKNSAVEYYKKKGLEVKVSDLYNMEFNPVGGKDDFKSIANPDFFKYQQEQVNAYVEHSFTDELQIEMDKLEWCDLLIFNFPLWWFGLPSILKGWVDRVFAMGYVYGNGKGVYENGTFKEKKAMITMTTGGPEIAYNGEKNGNLDTILFPINHGMFYFTGMQVVPPFISYGPARKTEDELKIELERYTNYLNSIDDITPIYPIV